ncbi:MAG: sigma-54 dependent transcriptional regulator [Phycisphaerae bacterium]|nr:sigma-54 dependent transcriptional regulator [Phycisphaerae bacterium]
MNVPPTPIASTAAATPLTPRDRRRILVVDDDTLVATSLGAFLAQRGYEVSIANDVDSAAAQLRAAEHESDSGPRRPFAVLVTDIAMPGADRGAMKGPRSRGVGGLELIRLVREERLSPAVIAITGYGTVESAVEAIREGATDYLTKPLADETLLLSIERAVQRQALLAENRSMRQQLDRRNGLESIVGTDPRMLKIYELVNAVAPTRTTVLMTGESGTGKSLIARAIHQNSPRADKPYVELSCGSIPETLLESELFGHVKGAFTGAHVDKKGRFLAAHGGTLFLDEINSASPGMQLKLLRVLQERRFEPVGSTETIEVDVRVVLASNQPLEQLVAEGHFRQDLYYRINVVAIDLPPLRDRIADIPHLADHFLRLQCLEHHRQIAGFTDESMALLNRYPFPGNVRELENVIERAVVLSRGGMIQPADLPTNVTTGTAALMCGAHRPNAIGAWAPAHVDAAGPSLPALKLSGPANDNAPWVPMTLDEALRDPERSILLRALKANHWNRQKTADQLGINRTTLYKKMKTLGLDGHADQLERAG